MPALLSRATLAFPGTIPSELRQAAQDGGPEEWRRLGDILYERSYYHPSRKINPNWSSDPDIMADIKAQLATDEANWCEATFWFRKAIAHGSIPAQYGLGRCLLMVSTSPVLRAEGMAWVRQAAESGHAPAQCLMGDILQSGGFSLDKNEDEAEKWLLKAAAQGEAEAQRILQGRLQSASTAN